MYHKDDCRALLPTLDLQLGGIEWAVVDIDFFGRTAEELVDLDHRDGVGCLGSHYARDRGQRVVYKAVAAARPRDPSSP